MHSTRVVRNTLHNVHSLKKQMEEKEEEKERKEMKRLTTDKNEKVYSFNTSLP